MSGIMGWLETVQWLILLGLVVATLGLLHQVGKIRRRLGEDRGVLVPNDGLPLDSVAPPIEVAERRTGQPVRLGDYRGRGVVVAFLSPSCVPCVKLVPHLNRLAKERAEPVIVVAEQADGADLDVELSSDVQVVGDTTGELARAYQVQRRPLVYVIHPDGTVAMRTVPNNRVDLEDTLDGFGRLQGDLPWVTREEVDDETMVAAGQSGDGVSDQPLSERRAADGAHR
jgi:methylamine dehydrogenase accessory protein MauD